MMQQILDKTSESFIALEEQYGAHNYHPLDVVIHEGSGGWATDGDGKRYRECLSAYSAVNQGHALPTILKAMMEQSSRVPLASRLCRNEQLCPVYSEGSAVP